MTVNYLIWLFVKPSNLILVVAILGVVFWRTRFGRWCRSGAIVMIIVFGLVPTAALLIRPLETYSPLPANLGRVDGIVVLGGSEMTSLSVQHQQPQLNSMGDRLTTFLALATRFPNARLVHSGRGQTRVAEALLLDAGVDPARISLDDESQNTCDSATNIRELVAPKAGETWLLVTSAYHMPRAVACFQTVGWNVVPYPADFRRGAEPFYFGLTANLDDLDLAVHEWLGLAYYRLRGRTEHFWPRPTS